MPELAGRLTENGAWSCWSVCPMTITDRNHMAVMSKTCPQCRLEGRNWWAFRVGNLCFGQYHLAVIRHYIYTGRKKRFSVTPGHRTVQEGLSMVSCREGITKSKHVFHWKLFTPNFRPWWLCQYIYIYSFRPTALPESQGNLFSSAGTILNW